MSAYSSYAINNNGNYISVSLIKECNLINSKSFDIDLTKKIAESKMPLLVNCEQIDDLSSDWLRILLRAQVELKKSDHLLRLVSANSKIKKQIKDEGFDHALVCCDSVKDALVDFGVSVKRKLDTEFINPFLSATLTVLEIQASVKATSQKIYLKTEKEQLVGDISGVIGILSDSFRGTVVISFPEATFLNIMSNMLGEPVLKLDKEMLDGAGELTNMIFGHAKKVLNEKGYGIKMALPSVVQGKDHSLSSNTKGPVVVIPFVSEIGNFFVEVGMDC